MKEYKVEKIGDKRNTTYKKQTDYNITYTNPHIFGLIVYGNVVANWNKQIEKVKLKEFKN